MTEKEYLYLLCHATGIGAVTVFKLKEYFRDFESVWNANTAALEKSEILTSKQLENLLACQKREKKILEEYESLSNKGIRFVAYFENEYPGRLLEYHDRPAGLFVKGNLPEDGRPSVAIIGARNCTEYGKATAEHLSEKLSGEGVQIISGLALGVDGAAHRGALNAGGATFAVLGSGVNVCYPREHYYLFEEMQKKGGVLSEFMPGTVPAAMNFPMRNRIISGLSDAVIITEAREKSGSLITADLALEQGKEIFAVPGRWNDPLSAGCNRLLQMGAAICLGVNDIFEFLGLKYKKKLIVDKISEKRLAKKEIMVYSFLDSRPKYLEEIVKNCQISVSEAMEILMSLELSGLVQSAGNQYYCRKM